MMTEIPTHKDYLINESGIIIKKDTGELVKISANNDGIMYARLDNRKEYIHDLICVTYMKPSGEYKYPIHMDGDPMNNHVTNIGLSKYIMDDYELQNRGHRQYSRSQNPYVVFNEETGDSVTCYGRGAVAELIQYEEISLKNMVGNGRKITLGPFKGYQIERIK